jgi:hypothetical protein
MATHTVKHDEIVKQFVDSKAVDFAALGKFVTELGPSIAISGRGDYGVRMGWYNILACFNIAVQAVSPVETITAGMASEVLGQKAHQFG